MEIIGEVSQKEFISAIMQGSGTTYKRVNEKQKLYWCVGCRKLFYSDQYCAYYLCDEDFGVFNLWNFLAREEYLLEKRKRYPDVIDWIGESSKHKMHLAAFGVSINVLVAKFVVFANKLISNSGR